MENLKSFLTDDEVVSEEFTFCNELAFPNETPQEEEFDSLHEDALEYIAGFIVRKLGLTEHVSNEPTYTWVDEVSRGGLTKPSTSFLCITKQLEVVFKTFNGTTVRNCDNYLQKLIACSEHVGANADVKKLFFKTRMYQLIKNLNRSIKNKKR